MVSPYTSTMVPTASAANPPASEASKTVLPATSTVWPSTMKLAGAAGAAAGVMLVIGPSSLLLTTMLLGVERPSLTALGSRITTTMPRRRSVRGMAKPMSLVMLTPESA